MTAVAASVRARPDALEIASGMIMGTSRTTAPPPPDGTERRPPRDVLEGLLVPALEHGPCLVAFSGGRDSSAVLATVVHVARRHGLPLPIPVTMRYPHLPRTHEEDWQALVLRHLGLPPACQEFLELGTELDLGGSLYTGLLRRHGLFWPPNIHSMLALARAASGGTLVTGNGGDELLSAWGGRRLALIRRGRAWPRRSDLKWLVATSIPRRAAVALLGRRRSFFLPWMTEEGLRQVERRHISRMVRTDSWADEIELFLASRYRELANAAIAMMEADSGARFVQPFADARFMRAVVASAPADGYPSRTEVLRTLFGDLLPEAAVTRSTKAAFTEILWGPESRAFAQAWDGTGVDPELVDVDRLRAEWCAKAYPDFRALPAFQAALQAAQS